MHTHIVGTNRTMAVQLPPYPQFEITDDPSVASKWEDWIDGFEAMITAMKVKEAEDKKAMLVHYAGGDVRKLLKKLPEIPGEDKTVYETAKEALTSYFSPKMNRVYLMYALLQLKQKPGETMDSFHMRVQEKMKPIDLESLTKAEIIDLLRLTQLVNNCTNTTLRKKALKDGLKIDDFLDHARASERADLQTKEIEEAGTSHIQAVSGVKDAQPRRQGAEGRNPRWRRQATRTQNQNNDQTPNSEKPKEAKQCYRCGGPFPHVGPCPALRVECNKCHRIGHYGKVCMSVTKNTVRMVHDQDTDSQDQEDDYLVIPYVTIAAIEDHTCAEIQMGETKFQVVVDTGASVNVMSEQTYKHMSTHPLVASDKKLCAYGPEGSRTKLPIIGKIQGHVQSNITQKRVKAEFHVIQGKASNLLGCSTAAELGLVSFPARAVNARSTTLEDLMEEYADRFQGIGKLDTQVKLHIDDKVTPIQQKTRRVPFHVRDEVENELDRLQEMDIIEEASGPTTWVSPIVIVHKTQGVRICIDSRAINTAIKRERYPIPTIDEVIAEMNGATRFSKIDLNKGYHQLELHPESRPITVFTTHKGLFQYKRLSFGINSAAEIFQKKVAEVVQNIPGVRNISDDIIIFTKDEEHLATLRRVLQRLRDHNLTMSKEKCIFDVPTIDFFGHTFSADGVAANKKKIEVILEAGAPETRSELQSLLGMSQYVSRFVANYSSIVAPLQQLTHQNENWRWETEHQAAFEQLKTRLAETHTLSYFQMNLPTELIVDASPVGLGAVLTQKTESGEIKVIGYASRRLTPTESRYSQTEREALAVVWACEHYHTYLFGADLTVISDHKPLEGIMNNPLSKPTARLERLCLRLQPYKVSIKYRRGSENTADFLSRHPVDRASKRPWLDEQMTEVCVSAIHTYEEEGLTLEEIRKEVAEDPEMQYLVKGITDHKWFYLEDCLKPYNPIKDELCVADGIILRGDRILIPPKLQKRAVKIAHRSHQGIVKTKALLRETLWFPGMDKLVEQAVSGCLPCQAATHGGTIHEPLRMSPLPEGAWEEVSIDFCGPFPTGEYLLVVVDDFSRYPEVEIVHSTSASATIPRLDAIFARHGIPKTARTDNGPPFNGELFDRWCRTIGMEHRKITPLWPKANGEAERFMRTIEKATRTAMTEHGSWKQEIFQFLRHYRATPHSTSGSSPAEMLFNRKMRTELPVPQTRRRWSDSDTKGNLLESLRQKDRRVKAYMKELADARNHSKMSTLAEGDSVLVRQRKVDKLSTPFSTKTYEVKRRVGSMITAQCGTHRTTRNISMFKQVNLPVPEQVPASDPVVEDTPEIPADSAENVPLDRAVQQAGDNLRRSGRDRKPPQHLNDYVCK